MKVLNLENLLKVNIKKLQRIRGALPNRSEYIRFEKNERLIPLSNAYLEEIKSNITSEIISAYYELGPLYKKLASSLGICTEQILFAAGSDLAIKSVYESCINEGDEIIVPNPCYAMYNVYGEMFGASVLNVSLKDDWGYDIEQMLELITERTKFMVIENPSGSTGSKLSYEYLEDCANKLLKHNALLLIDEAYSTFNDNHTLHLIESYPNVVVSRSFSKVPGIAGLRVGYLCGTSELISSISNVRPMHEITSISAIAAEILIDKPYLDDKYPHALSESKHYLIEQLTSLNIDVRDTDTCFLLVKFPGSIDFCTELMQKGIIIKNAFDKPPLAGWTRVTVGCCDEIKSFIEALRQIMDEE